MSLVVILAEQISLEVGLPEEDPRRERIQEIAQRLYDAGVAAGRMEQKIGERH